MSDSSNGIVVTASDGNPMCLEQLGVLLKSMATNSPRTRIKVNLVGCDGAVGEALRLLNNLAEIENHPSPETKDTKGYMVCFRAGCVLNEIMHSDAVAWMDTDVIVRSDLLPLWEGLGPKSLKIRYRKDSPDKNKFQAGVFAIGHSDETIELVERWDSVISGLGRWFADQLWLYKLWAESKVELVEMPLGLNNVGDSTVEQPFLDDSIVWHCKSSHFGNPVFQREYQMYRGME